MGLDIRWPIALLFVLYGGILILFGATTDPAIFERSLGLNIDVAWGTAMLAFGVLMAALAFRASRRSEP